MKTKGTAKRIMAFVVSLMLTFSMVPSGVAGAEPETSSPSIILESSDKYVNKTDSKITLTATVKNITTEKEVYLFDGETQLGRMTIASPGEVYSCEIESVSEGVHNYKAEVKYKDGEEDKKQTSESIQIVSDAKKPTVTIDKNTIVAKSNATITGVAEDDGAAGIKLVSYKVGTNEGTVTVDADGKFSINAENSGDYIITAQDNAGNQSEAKTVSVTLDNVNPTITIDDNKEEYVSNKNVVISGTAKDNNGGSGIKDNNVKYKVGENEGTATVDADGKFSINAENSGDYIITVEDNAGGSDSKTVKVTIDKNKPVINDITIPDANSKGWVIDKDATVTVSANDNNTGTGVKCVYYGTEKINGEVNDESTLAAAATYKTATKTENNYTFTADSTNKYYCYAVDNAGNVSDCKEVDVKIDKSKITLNNLIVKRSDDLKKYLDFLVIYSKNGVFNDGVANFIANNTMTVSFELEGSKPADIGVKVYINKGKNDQTVYGDAEIDGTKYTFAVPSKNDENAVKTTPFSISVKNNVTGKDHAIDIGTFTVFPDKPSLSINKTNNKVYANPGTDNPGSVIIEKIFCKECAENEDISLNDLIKSENGHNGASADIKFANEKKRVAICAVDTVGNVSDILYVYDTKAPEVTIDNQAVIDGIWKTEPISINVSVDNKADDGDYNVASPVKLNYWTDQNPDNIQVAPLSDSNNATIEDVQDVDTVYHFQAVDEAGNKSAEKTVSVKVDTVKPVISAQKDQNDGWTNKNTNVKVSVTQKGVSGIAEVFAVKKGTKPQEDGTFKAEDKITPASVNDDKTTCEFALVVNEGENLEQNYVFFAVSNAGLRSDPQTVEIAIDKHKPVFTLTKAPESVWTNKDVKVTVSDVKPGRSGVKEVFAVKKDKIQENGTFNAEDKIMPASVNNDRTEYEFDFIVNDGEDLNQEYCFYVENNAGTKSYPKTVEIAIDKHKPEFTLTKDPSSEWTNNNVTVTVSGVTTGPSKVKEVFAVKKGTKPQEDGTFKAEDKIMPNDGTEYEFDFEDEQKQEYYFYVVSNSGMYSGKDIAVNIEKQAPTVTAAEVSEQSAEHSFGIFSNSELKITVNAQDENETNSELVSGVSKIIMKDQDGTHTYVVSADDNGDFVFTVPVPEPVPDNSFIKDVLYSAIRFVAVDNAGNKSEETTLADLLKNTVNGNVLVDTQRPTIDPIVFSKEDYKDGDKIWYSNISKVKASVTAKDPVANEGKDASGIGELTLSASESKAEPFSINGKTSANNNETIELGGLTLNDIAKDGSVSFKATAKDVAENGATDQTGKVYIDNKAPGITGITVNGRSAVGSNSTYVVPAFSNASSISIKINAADTTSDRNGSSGVKKIHYELYDINEKRDVKSGTLKVDNSNSITITADANFKGFVRAYAIDNVGNQSPIVTTNRFVVENSTRHNGTSNINVTMPETSRRDVNGRLLYSDDVRIAVNVTDTYSGVKKIEYSLNGQWFNLPVSTWSSRDSEIYYAAAATIVVSKTAYNRNDNVLNIRITDNAGNTSVLDTSRQVHFSIDTVVPTISVAYDNNDYNRAYTNTQYYKANRTATITIQERNFNEKDIKAAITSSNGRTPIVSSFATHPNASDPDKTTHTATVTFSDDADYTFGLDYTDLAGHKASHYGEDRFTVDKTSPTTTVTLSSNPKNGKYYNEKQTVTVKVKEHNFDKNLVNINALQGVLPNQGSLQWISDGDVHTTTFILNADDVYAFNVSVADKARNNADVFNQPQFVIDQTKPDALITEAEQGKAYGVSPDIHPTIQGKDVNLSTVTYKITKKQRDGTSADVTKDFSITSVNDSEGDKKVISYRGMAFEQKESMDGIYTVEANVTDLAGNNTPISKTFSINRFGANYTIDDKSIIDEVLNKYIKEGRDFKIKAINVTPINDTEIVVICNGKEKKLSSSDYKVNLIHEEGGWYEYEYTINKDVFSDDGSYSLRLSASDEAGNTSRSDDDAHNEKVGNISFFVDSIIPSVSITGADDGQSYKEQSKEITVKIEDANIETKDFADYVHIFVNGKELNDSEYSEVESETGVGVVTLRFNVTDTDAEVTAYGVDLAGNESEHQKLNFKLDQNWLQRFYNNQKGAFFATAGGILALIAALIFFIIKKKKS